ncbi:GNAT family N-acetyltransferase [Gemella sp. GH3]|uniref:GNAT family N-acetyltransferase n=1 Tax=unclassified Gemella TaxID=2624949 RepID=UPI0015CFB361|nr:MULTISPECIES: GNAT family N-acetyltransferase [unclassified Gemella]MBF0714174.1 GNAT family N-acetyltransferase [Gemella sp. GH3.1]NYS51126.1 GNAT family N-acetyltransferase [Gemella sp. GH3]
MSYSFINIHTKSKVVLETDKYLIHRRIKSNISYSDNYLEIKTLPESTEDIDYYVSSCRDFFRDKGVNFIHLALPEDAELPKKLVKYLKNEGFNEISFDLFTLNKKDTNFIKDSDYTIEILDKVDYAQYLEFNYAIDLEIANKEWADYNKDNIYDNIRSENIIQVVAKDKNKIVGIVNIILSDDYFEIDALYVKENYRRKGIASHILKFAIEEFDKENIILVADSADTPKYIYQNIGFKKEAFQKYYLKSQL